MAWWVERDPPYPAPPLGTALLYPAGSVVKGRWLETGRSIGTFTELADAVNRVYTEKGNRAAIFLAPGAYRIRKTIVVKGGVLRGCGRITAIYTPDDITLIHVLPVDWGISVKIEDLYVSPRAQTPTAPAVLVEGADNSSTSTPRVLNFLYIERVPADLQGVGLELRASGGEGKIGGVQWSHFSNIFIFGFDTGILLNALGGNGWINSNTFTHVIIRRCRYGVRATGNSTVNYGIRVNRFYHLNFEGDFDTNVVAALDFTNPDVYVYNNTFVNCTVVDLPANAKALQLGPACHMNTFADFYCDPNTIVWGGYGNAVYLHSFPYQRFKTSTNEQYTTSTAYVDTDTSVTVHNFGMSRLLARATFQLRSDESGGTVQARLAVFDPANNLIASNEVLTNSTSYVTLTAAAAADALATGTYTVKLQYCRTSTANKAYITNKVLEVKLV